MALIEEQIAQLENGVIGEEAQQGSKIRQRDLLIEERQDLDELFEEGYVARTRILALEREIARYDGEVGAHVSAIASFKRQISESRLEMSQLQRES